MTDNAHQPEKSASAGSTNRGPRSQGDRQHQGARKEGPSQGGNGQRRRKRRRRSSSSGQHGQQGQGQNQQAQNPQKAQAGAPKGHKQSSESQPNVKKKRRRRGKGGAAQNKNRSRNQHTQRGGNAKSRPNPKRPNEARMTTRDETSAGGLVISGMAEAVSPTGEVDLSRIYVALIGRLDRRGRLLWSMPKGHVEPGEEFTSTAEREVWEETGISGQVCSELGVIDYWFVSDGVRIHKTVHHFLLRYLDGDLNDEDPEVTEVSWIPASELIEHLAYADERKLARIAHDRLPELATAEHAENRATPR